MSEYITHSREETVALGRKLAAVLPDGALIAFTGGLGAGKTARERDQRPGGQRFGKLTANGDGFLPRMGHKFLHKQAPCFGPHKARPHTYIL